MHALVGAALVFVAVPSHAQAGGEADLADAGPLRIRDQFLLNTGLLAFDPDMADPLAPVGRKRIEVTQTISNTFAKSAAVTSALNGRTSRLPADLEFLRSVEPSKNIFYLDGEVYRTAARLDYQASSRIQFGVTFQWLDFDGGVLDHSIEQFHDAFGLDQAGRLAVPRNRYTVYVRSNGREVFRDREPVGGFGDIVLRSKFTFLPRPSSLRLAVATSVKLPVANENSLFSSGSIDVGAQLIASKDYANSCWHGAIGLVRLGAWKEFALDPQTVVSGMLAYERQIGRSSSVIAQLTASQSPFRQLSLRELGQLAVQTSVGFKFHQSRRNVFYVAFTENLVHFNNTADIGFHAGMSRLY